MTPESLPVDYIKKTKFLHVSGISQAISPVACDTVFAAIEIARSTGVRISYDTNLRLKLWPLTRARALVNAAVPLCNVVFLSLDDSIVLTGRESHDAIADFYLSLGAPLVALKLASKSVLLATPEERWQIKGLNVKTVDATGAGDTFDGAFLAMLAKGREPLFAAHYANTAAALSTCRYGAVAPIPTAAQVRITLNE